MGHRSNIDADIDSLTSMLADLDSHQQDPNTQVGGATRPPGGKGGGLSGARLG